GRGGPVVVAADVHIRDVEGADAAQQLVLEGGAPRDDVAGVDHRVDRELRVQLLDDVVGLRVVVDVRDVQDRDHVLLVQTQRQRVRGDVQRGDLPHELGERVAVALVVAHRAVAEVRDVRGLGEQALELRLVQRLGGERRGGGGEGGADDGDRAAAGQHGA